MAECRFCGKELPLGDFLVASLLDRKSHDCEEWSRGVEG